jgi:hypothetical protein
MGVRALANNFRHRTPDRPEAEQSHVAVLGASIFCGNILRANFFFAGWCVGDS